MIDGAVGGFVFGAVGCQQQTPCRLHQGALLDIPFLSDGLDLFLGDRQGILLVADLVGSPLLCAFRQRKRVGVGGIAEGFGIPLARLCHLGLVGAQRFFFLRYDAAVYCLAYRLLAVIAALDFLVEDYQ